MFFQNRRCIRNLCYMMCLVLIVSCTSTSKDVEVVNEEKLSPLTYTFYDGLSFSPLDWYELNEIDVVTKYITERFNISVSKVYYNKGLSFQERFNQLLASKSLPDVITVQAQNSFYVANSGFYIEVGPLIEKYMPNLLKWIPEDKWNENLIEGKLYGIPNPWIDTTTKEFEDDIYIMPASNWTLFTREDILTALGYEFTSMNEIATKLNNNQAKLQIDDLAIQPKIETPDDLIEFLRNVKEYAKSIGRDNLIPLSIPWWLQGHFGYMFGMTNGWHYNESEQDIHAYLGDPRSKQYYKFLNQLYREDLLDHEILSQENEHLENKWRLGYVAVGMWLQDPGEVQEHLLRTSSTDFLRPIEFPRLNGLSETGIDHFSQATFQTFIRKDFEDIPRLMKYFDWMLSDEGLDMATWGPETSQLWKIEEGKKILSDPEMWNAYISGISIAKRPENYGLGYDSQSSVIASRAVATGISLRGYNPKAIERSYPFYKTQDSVYTLAYNTISTMNLDRNGYLNEGYNELTTGPTNYMWDVFFPQKSILLIAASNDDEFERNWEQIMKEFVEATNYNESKKAMVTKYREAGFIIAP